MSENVAVLEVYPVERIPPAHAAPFVPLARWRWELWATDGTFLTAQTSCQKDLEDVHKAARTTAEALGYVVAA